jgi:hypothetical protein
VALHIGAHKTASTHLQGSLNAAALDLADCGVRFYGPDYLRIEGRSLPAMFGLAQNSAPRRPPAQQLNFLAKDGHRVLFSEENFCGLLHDGAGGMPIPLYPMAEERLLRLVDVLAPVPVDAFIAIRSPARFVTSAYSQTLMGGHVMPFRAFRAANPFRRIGWAAYVERLRAVAGLRGLTVWRYEDYAQVFDQIVSALAGEVAAAMVQPRPKPAHRSLSARAVKFVLSRRKAGDAGDLALIARNRFPASSDGSDRFDPFSPDDHAASERLYAAQVAKIAAMPGVTLLSPPN